MAQNFKFVLDTAGVRELLRSPEVSNMIDGKVKEIARRAGDGYETNTMTGKNRIQGRVYAESKEAQKDNMDNNTLLKAVR